MAGIRCGGPERRCFSGRSHDKFFSQSTITTRSLRVGRVVFYMVPSWGAAVLRPYMNGAVRELRRVVDRAKLLGKSRDLENDRGYRVAGIHRADMGRSGPCPYTCSVFIA